MELEREKVVSKLPVSMYTQQFEPKPVVSYEVETMDELPIVTMPQEVEQLEIVSYSGDERSASASEAVSLDNKSEVELTQNTSNELSEPVDPELARKEAEKEVIFECRERAVDEEIIVSPVVSDSLENDEEAAETIATVEFSISNLITDDEVELPEASLYVELGAEIPEHDDPFVYGFYELEVPPDINVSDGFSVDIPNELIEDNLWQIDD